VVAANMIFSFPKPEHYALDALFQEMYDRRNPGVTILELFKKFHFEKVPTLL